MGFLDRFRPSPPAVEDEPVSNAFAPLLRLALEGAELTRLRAALTDGLLAHGVSRETVPAVMEHVRDGIVLLERGGSDRASRIGGRAQLPPGAEWPQDRDGKPLTFMASFDLQELPDLEPLPAAGRLLVFWSENYFQWERMDFRVATRVFWVPPGVEPVDAETPDGATTYAPEPLTGVLMPILGETESITIPDEDDDSFYDALDDLNLHVYCHQLLGSSRDVQGPVLGEVAYWFDAGFPETREEYTDSELAGEGWSLLGQIDSSGDLMFGDAGSLYLLIPDVDLAARRFDRVLGVMQCF